MEAFELAAGQRGDRRRVGLSGSRPPIEALGRLEQAPAHRALTHDVGVGADPSNVRQIEIETGQVRQAADLLEFAAALERGLQSADVDRRTVRRQLAAGIEDDLVALEIEVRHAEGDLLEQRGVEEDGAEDGALGFVAVRQDRHGGCHASGTSRPEENLRSGARGISSSARAALRHRARRLN